VASATLTPVIRLGFARELCADAVRVVETIPGPVSHDWNLYDLILLQLPTSNLHLFICRFPVESDHVSSRRVVEFLRCNESK
jgi:hypothetical protein